VTRCFHLFTGSDGASHVAEIDLPVGTVETARRVHVEVTAPGAARDWHTAPTLQYVVTLTGTLEFTTRGGEQFELRPGDVLLAADTTGTGHRWRMIDDQPWTRMYVELSPDAVAAPGAPDARATVVAFVDAFQRADLASLEALLADDFVGHVTTADGGTRDVDRAGYVDSVRAMDVGSAHLRVDVTNTVEIAPGRVLVMVEVHAARAGATLHNFSGQLATVADGRITSLWMVDALPAESDRFWST